MEIVYRPVENFDRLWKTCIFSFLIALIGLISPSLAAPIASIHTYPEPNGVMYRSLSTLQDLDHRAWQAVVYKRFVLGQPETLKLRLVGFPGAVTLQHPKELAIDTKNRRLLAPDVTAPEFPLAHVGEYDLKPMIADLDTDSALTLVLPLQNGEIVTIDVPSKTLQEWWRVASWQPQTPKLM